MWMGGNVPLGYDVKDRKLIVNEVEAETVRLIFRRYAELGSVRALGHELDQLGVVSKRREGASVVLAGGNRFSRGALYSFYRSHAWPHPEILLRRRRWVAQYSRDVPITNGLRCRHLQLLRPHLAEQPVRRLHQGDRLARERVASVPSERSASTRLLVESVAAGSVVPHSRGRR